MRKWLGEITLLGQPFVKDDKQTGREAAEERQGEGQAFVRYEVGAGIEKKQEDFVAEVMAQAKAQKQDRAAGDKH